MSEHLQTDYYYQALQMKKKLDAVSPTMCLAKWLQVSIHLTTGRTQSCYHPPTHPISQNEIAKNPKALHNTQQKISERKMMLAGTRPQGCEYCWKVEDSGGNHLSDRIFRSGEPWAREAFDEVVKNSYDYDINPRYVEVNFNAACNLKCSYCSPNISTSWADECKKLGPFPTLVPHNDISYFESNGLMPMTYKDDNPYETAFWEWWPDLYKDLKVFRMTGGEPLLDRNTFRVFDWINANPRSDLELAITSNMCAPQNLMSKFISQIKPIVMEKKVKRFTLFPSIDSWGQQAEYIRNGMDFEYFWNNVNRYLEEVPDGIVNFIITMNCLSVTNLKSLMQGYLDLQKKFNRNYHRIFFDTPFLRYPSWQSLQILPPQYHYHIEELIEFMKANMEVENSYIGFRDFQLARMERVLAWMKQTPESSLLEEARINFYRFFKAHDERRKTNFLGTFPELKEFWEQCKQLTETHPS